MGDFAIVGEGITDQIVLRNIILAYHDDREPEPLVVFEQPPLDTTGAAGLAPAPGGWSLVVRYLRARRYLQALQLNRYVVIQIDTDIADDLGVRRPDTASDDDFIELVIQKLCSHIEPADLERIRDRLLFAIGFDEIECWLLPAVFDRSEKPSLAKITGCLEALNRKLLKSNEKPLSAADGQKNPDRYRQLSARYRRRRHLDDAASNPGFARFLRELGERPLGMIEQTGETKSVEPA